MRLGAALQGDLRRIVAAEWRAGGKAIRGGLRDAAVGLRGDLRRDAENAGLDRLGKVWRHKVYGGRGGPWDAAAIVYPKGGERTRGAIYAYEHGATIRARKGRYLLIPTGFNLSGGRRGQRVLYRPEELENSFVRRSRNGNLFLWVRVQHAQRLRKGRVQDLAYVNTHLLGSGRVRRSRDILERGAVPMFLLLPRVTVQKKLNIAWMTERWRRRLPYLIVRKWNRQGG